MTRNQTEAMALDAAARALRACESLECVGMVAHIEALAERERAADAGIRPRRVAPERFNACASMSDEELLAARVQVRRAMRLIWDESSFRAERSTLVERYDAINSEIERRKVRR